MAIATETEGPVKASDRASVDDVRRLDLRVGEIVALEPLPKSDRLLVVSVDLGTERRTLVAGIGKAFLPEELIGMKVVVAANIAPATIRGIRSNGTLLGVGCEDPSAVSLLTVTGHVVNGASVV